MKLELFLLKIKVKVDFNLKLKQKIIKNNFKKFSENQCKIKKAISFEMETTIFMYNFDFEYRFPLPKIIFKET